MVLLPLLLAANTTLPARIQRKEQYAVYFQTANEKLGQGCVIGPRQVLTAAHVQKNGITRWFSRFFNRSGTVLTSRVNEKADIAQLVTMSEEGWSFSDWVNIGKEPQFGDALYTYLWLDSTPTTGRAFMLMKDPEGGEFTADGWTGYGSSGGCILDNDGNLVGIMTGSRFGPQSPEIRPTIFAAPVWNLDKTFRVK